MFRLVQISDTHLSPGKRHFAGNWPPVAEWIASLAPDVVVHTGDVTLDGADRDEDLAWCAELLGAVDAPVLAVPGNHDVGDAGNRRQPINADRLARWRSHFGRDRWIHDIEGWRLIGFNSLLFSSGDAEEAAQDEWLGRAVEEADGRPIAWFTHRPLFLVRPDEGDGGYWTVKPRVRSRLCALIEKHDVRLVATGHLHRWHDFELDGTRYVWGPSSGFLVGAKEAPPMPGAAALGGVVYDFDGDAMSVRHAPIEGLMTYWIDDLIDEVYPVRESTR